MHAEGAAGPRSPARLTGPLVVGYSGSAESTDAMALTRVLARVLRAPVIAVSVLTSAPLEVDARTFTADLEAQGERLQREAERALAELNDVEVVAVSGPSPAREIDRIAGERAASMIILGSTHRGAVGRVVPGTVADRLLTIGTCPIAIAPRGFASSSVYELQTIGVGFDGSTEARSAIAEAGAIAEAAGASLDLITVVDPAIPSEVPGESQGRAASRDRTHVSRGEVDHWWSAIRSALGRLAPTGVAAAIHILEGDPAEVLTARSGDLDLLVLGSRGEGPLGRVLLGGVSSAVARECACPLLVTPRSAGRGEASDVDPGLDRAPSAG